MNKVIRIFEELRQIYEDLNDTYRVRAYTNAIESLKNGTTEGIGKKLLSKIEIIKKTGKLDELIEMRKYVRLMKLPGFGKSFINKLIDNGIKPEPQIILKSQKKLAEKGIILNRTQLIGLENYKELIKEKKIKREIITDITHDLENHLMNLGIILEKFVVVGSYRRGVKESRDIDILVVTDDNMSTEVMKSIYNAMKQYKYYVTHLVLGSTKFTFLLKYKRAIIQVDIRVIPHESYPTALLYFTGSKLFNVQMRHLAKIKGYILNEYELKKIPSKRIEVHSEADIFNELGLEYIPPEKRNNLTIAQKA